MPVDIHLVQVTDENEAARRKFLGSPSFHISGIDLWPEERKHYGLSCRVYTTPQGLKGAPTAEMLRERV